MVIVKKYRIYPTQQQKILFAKIFGSVRFVYNYFLEVCNKEYKASQRHLSYFSMCSLLTQLKQEKQWLNEISVDSLQQSLKDLDRSFVNFFNQRSSFPSFKSRKCNRETFRVMRNIYIKNNKLLIPKFREGIKIKLHCSLPQDGAIKSATILKNPANQYYVCLNIKIPDKKIIKQTITPETTIGIDLGIKTFATFDNGKKIDNPKFFVKIQERLAKEQRRLSKMQKGSNNRNKQRIKVAKLHQKITNQRNDFLHKLTYKLTHDNQVSMICIENLSVKELLKEQIRSKNIADASWRRFREFLTYKCSWYSKTLFVIDRYAPSSKMCSNCGYINHNLALSNRDWTCPNCNKIHDRDINAAINIKNIGIKHFYNNTKN